jgi:hypothetical protein
MLAQSGSQGWNAHDRISCIHDRAHNLVGFGRSQWLFCHGRDFSALSEQGQP